MKTITLPSNTSINRSPSPLAVLFIPLAVACFALVPQARATCQEGCDTFNNNTFLGDDALINDINPGVRNTAIGAFALTANTIGLENTATGAYALQFSTTSSGNTATGAYALSLNTTGGGNTATGAFALQSNTDGYNNTATGYGALAANTVGWQNTAIGLIALAGNTTGSANTATGDAALNSNSIGNGNTAIGEEALFLHTAGNNNTAIGLGALSLDTTGNNNIAVGFEAGMNLTTGRNNIDIFDKGVAGESNTIRIGTARTQTNAYIAGISGVTVANGVGVIIDARGHLGTIVSSERFKDEVKSMDKASEAILALKPVTFRYKHDLDPEGIPQFGLVAEDVEQVNPDLVARDEQGKPYTVRYEAVNAMLLNEFLKEHRKVESLEKTMAEQQTENAAMRAMLKAQAEQIQKVQAQIESSKPALQTLVGNR